MHLASVIIFILQTAFYVTLSTLLEYYYYHKQCDNKVAWKIQPSANSSVAGTEFTSSLPILLWVRQGSRKKRSEEGQQQQQQQKQKQKQQEHQQHQQQQQQTQTQQSNQRSNQSRKHRLHPTFATINLFFSSCFAAVVTEMSLTTDFAISFRPFTWTYILYKTVIAILWQAVLEYYWHRLMHMPLFYKCFHKYHHYYKSPEPFDDMFIHPIEAIGYYMILYSPAVCLGAMPLFSFLIYMSIMGLAGVVDHSGIRIIIPYLYDSGEHDQHHRLVNVNYSFPFPWMDWLHATYVPPAEFNKWTD